MRIALLETEAASSPSTLESCGPALDRATSCVALAAAGIAETSSPIGRLKELENRREPQHIGEQTSESVAIAPPIEIEDDDLCSLQRDRSETYDDFVAHCKMLGCDRRLHPPATPHLRADSFDPSASPNIAARTIARCGSRLPYLWRNLVTRFNVSLSKRQASELASLTFATCSVRNGRTPTLLLK